jgi:hypothetical protein
MTSSTAKVTSANARHVTSAEAADVASAEAAHVASAKAPHMAATTPVSPATATAGLCTGGNQAAGKQRACQNHHHSSSHYILLRDGRDFSPLGLVRRWRVPMDERWGYLGIVSIKFAFNHPWRGLAAKVRR